MKATQHYDAIIIGAGQSGGPLTTALAGAGRKVALIEREHIGGTCINTGCTPTKTMIASGRVAYLARRAADYGVRTGPVSVDVRAVRARKRELVESFRKSSREQIEGADGADLLFGEAEFTGSKQVDVALFDGGSRTLSADMVFINTGARPGMPPVEGLEEVGALDSTTVMELEEAPEHLLVLGGGYIGLEFGQLYRRFGSRVTIAHRGPQLMSGEDADVACEVANILREDGIEVLLNAEAYRAQRRTGGEIHLSIRSRSGGQERTLTGSHLLVAAGRKPNTEGLNLEATGVSTDDRGFVQVNDRLETNAPGIYAMGDVTGGPQFTHISYDDFRILRTNLIDGGDATTIGRLAPYTIFIDPQLGRVGMTEEQARSEGRNIRVAKMPMNQVARALETDEPRGSMKAVVDADTEQILGCAALGLEGGEIMAMMQIAMMGKLPYTALRDGIFAHPTLAESLNNLFGNLE